MATKKKCERCGGTHRFRPHWCCVHKLRTIHYDGVCEACYPRRAVRERWAGK